MKTEQRPNLQTGHLHLPLTQNKGLPEAYNNANNQNKLSLENKYYKITNITVDMNPVIKDLVSEIKEIIKKI